MNRVENQLSLFPSLSLSLSFSLFLSLSLVSNMAPESGRFSIESEMHQAVALERPPRIDGQFPLWHHHPFRQDLKGKIYGGRPRLAFSFYTNIYIYIYIRFQCRYFFRATLFTMLPKWVDGSWSCFSMGAVPLLLRTTPVSWPERKQPMSSNDGDVKLQQQQQPVVFATTINTRTFASFFSSLLPLPLPPPTVAIETDITTWL